MKKNNTILLSVVFLLLLCAFFFASITYWYNSMEDKDLNSGNTRLLSYTASLLVLFSVVVWLPNRKKTQDNIHFVCILWCIIMPIVLFINHSNLVSYFLTLLWPVLFEASFVLTKIDSHFVTKLKRIFVLVAIYGTLLFFMSTRVAGGQTNSIYFAFLTLPWMLLYKKGRAEFIVLVVFTCLIVMSLKRSAMLVMLLFWVIYGMRLIKGKKNRIVAILAIFVMTLIGIYAYSFANNALGGKLMERVTETKEEADEGRGRLAIYAVTGEMILSSSPYKLLSGHGHYSVYKDSPLEITAHNDMLEVIYDYGLIVFILYLYIWFYVIKRCYLLYRLKSPLFFSYAVSVCIFVVMSSVSHLILYTSYFNFLVLFWGCVEALLVSNSERIINKRK